MLRALCAASLCLYALIGCGRSAQPTRPPAPARAQTLRGIVRSSKDFPTIGSIVVATNLATLEEVAVARVSAQGTFTLETPTKEVSLTVTNSRESKHIPKISDNTLEVQLSSECELLTGTIDFEGAPPKNFDLVRFARIGNSMDAIFAAIVDKQHRFSACLPRSDYQIFLPPEFAERIVVATVPARGALRVQASTRRFATMPPSKPLEVRPALRDTFVESLPDHVQVLALGETNHGTGEFTLERAHLMTALAQKRGFTTVLIESGLAESFALDSYVRGSSNDIDAAIERPGYWIWSTEEFRSALQEFRNYNAIVEPSHQIRIIGFDMQKTMGAIDFILENNADILPEEMTLLGRLRDKNGAAWTRFSSDDQHTTRRLLERLANGPRQRGVTSQSTRRALCARSLLLRLNHLEVQGFWNREQDRDRAMAQLVQEVLEAEPGSRSTLWAHLDHVSREYAQGAPTLGFHLATSMGARYQVYALLAYEGAARAKSINSKDRPIIEQSLSVAPAYSLEGVLIHALPGRFGDVSYWTFGTSGTRSSHWLRELHWIRAFGVYFPGDLRSYELHSLEAIDGAVLFRTISPSRPLRGSPRPPG